MKLFSKSKDYHNSLEEILDSKTFSSIAKNLISSMLYKLEISYRDYMIVKTDSLSEDVFFENILKNIKKYCEHIKFVEPESSQANLLIKNNVKALTNTKERSILCYPTEIAMLEAVSDIESKYFFIKKDFENKNIFQKMLVNGYKQNTIEILKCFNGWSWDIDSQPKDDIISYIIYQNIIMIRGERFLYEWRIDNKGKKNYLIELKNSIKNITGNDDYYLCLCNLLNMLKDKKEIEEIKHTIIELQKCFLEFMKKKIKRVSVREEIVKIIYQLRYYQFLDFFEGKQISCYHEIGMLIDSLWKLIITKACKLGVLKIISMDIETNFKFYKFIFDTRIIDLEQIRVYIEIKGKNILLKTYDKEVYEKQEEIELNGNKKDIVIKKNKLVNIFN